MPSQTAVAAQTLIPQKGWRRFWHNFKRDWMLHLFMLVPVVYTFLFSYIPVYGMQLAFKDYSPRAGIWGSPWIGFKHYVDFFNNYRWHVYVVNTVVLALYSLAVTFPLPIIFALIMHVYSGKRLNKLAQNITIMPHFISLVIMVGILNTLLNPVSGLVKYIGIHEDIRATKTAFRHMYVWSGAWQTFGWSSILYVSSLSAVPQELHEAAKLDGASRMRRILAVDLPTILPTIVMMLILRFGGIMSVGYQKVLLLQNEVNKDVSDILSLYVYSKGVSGGDYGFGMAIGWLDQIVNIVLFATVNKITSVLSDGEMGLF